MRPHRLIALTPVLALLFAAPLAAQDNEDAVHKIGDGVTAPSLVKKVEPEYTEEVRKARIRGTVVLYVEVWPDGKTHNERVERSLEPGLDQKALEAVRQWRFKPGEKDGKPVKIAATIEINFRP